MIVEFVKVNLVKCSLFFLLGRLVVVLFVFFMLFLLRIWMIVFFVLRMFFVVFFIVFCFFWIVKDKIGGFELIILK